MSDNPAVLTFEAEALADKPTSPEIVETLLVLLRHDSPVVREGAIYGCASHMGMPELFLAVDRMAIEDPSVGVRAAAKEALTR